MASLKAFSRKIGDVVSLRRARTASKLARAFAFAALAGIPVWGLAASSAPAWSAEPSFTAELDRQQIGQDDSVSVNFTVTSEGSVELGEVRFRAPDFDAINEYSSSFVKSFYDSASGRFGMTHSRKLTKVLRPHRTGRLTVSGIQVTVNGKTLAAPDLSVEVTAAGQATPPPRNYGGSGVGLRGAGKQVSGAQVQLRAEIDKDRVVKGEQVIISYYLYRRVRMFNFNIDKFPELKGFLREELEMPVMGQRLDSERVVVDGVPFERSLLVRYAAYPLQEGKLRIDALGLKYNYYAGTSDDGEDIFFQFYQQLTPRTASVRSDPVTVEVLPLPSEGRPANFSGGVGNFDVLATVDKYELRANEALTLTLKIEGRGNVAAIGEPRVKWPENLEFYDSKGQAKAARGGFGTKIFEFVLIPRAAGKMTLPPIEFGFYDPAKKSYLTRATDPIEIQVNPAAPGTVPAQAPAPARGQPASPAVSPTDGAEEARELKVPGLPEAARGEGLWHWLYLLSAAGSLLAVAWIGGSAWARAWSARRRGRAGGAAALDSKSWEPLQALARGSEAAPWAEISKAYDTVGYQVLDAIDRVHALGARSLARSELRERLMQERGFPAELWERIGRVLEFGETVRFASSLGAVSEQKARQELGRWVKEAESIVRLIERQRTSQG
ncbi:MAG: BatD family protein [Oligoflexia bacterium]|nr:BatD family protein [Oligoflexia bacterium]